MQSVSARAFKAMQNLAAADLAKCTEVELRPMLPCLVRMSTLPATDRTKPTNLLRTQVLRQIVGIEQVNKVIALLQIEFQELEADIRKEQQLRQKMGNANQDPAKIHDLDKGVALGFEQAEPSKKMRIVLSELFYIQSQIFEQNQLNVTRAPNDNIQRHSELFGNEIYLEEITHIICIILAEVPTLFQIQDLIETLLYVNYGSTIICWVVANMPDCFKEVVTALISNGDEETAEGRLRTNALNALCDMNPGQALATRTLCVEIARMPSLMLKLSLKDPKDLIAFVSGLLLGNDQNTRTWFSNFVRNNQKRKNDALQAVRDELLKQLQNNLKSSNDAHLADEYLIQGATILRLYCALRGIAGIKFNDDEIPLILQLITTKKPPPTPAGIRFVSIGLCMIIACPSLITQTLESKAIEWAQWLIREEAYLEANTPANASFSEMLLLMAIHFHGNQMSAICDLVCSTLGMKISLRQNNTARMKQIFTQDIFTEQVITAHSVKVPVTTNLNGNMVGYLPIHCIHQLLKSRSFTKHKVSIKQWIFNQICQSSMPLHPVLLSLIEAYVNAIIVPTAKIQTEVVHQNLAMDDIMKVFRNSAIGDHLGNDVKKPQPIGSKIDMKKSEKLEKQRHQHKSSGGVNENNDKPQELSNLSSQLLLLYYLLLYEDVRLSNMTILMAAGRKVEAYPPEFLNDLPIKYLMLQAQRHHNEFAGLFSPLLRLLVTHFPHLSLVEDWIDEESYRMPHYSNVEINTFHVVQAFEELDISAAKTIRLLRLMLRKSPSDIWPLADTFTKYIRNILSSNVPRLIQDLYKQVWIRLNTVLPRKLWTMTINSLMPDDYVWKAHGSPRDLALFDPLLVLRCDERVFRCPDILAIVLRILQASLAASKCQMARHMLDRPLQVDKLGQVQNENDREELKTALVASQESAAVQILLEVCLETDDDRRQVCGESELREVRGLICQYIHHVFISEPSMARLVHFQGYSRDLLGITVQGIPSMHICMDFVPELLGMQEMNKQIFAIDLTSHLSLQYAFPKSMSLAKLCVNSLSTLLGLLPSDARVEMFRSILPCLVRFAEAFPPLLEECMLILMQLGRLADAQASFQRSSSMPSLSIASSCTRRAQTRDTVKVNFMMEEIRETFSKLLDEAVLKPKIY